MAQNGATSPTDSSLSSRLSKKEESTREDYTRSSIGSGGDQARETLPQDLDESSPLLLPTRVNDGRHSEDHDTPTGLLDWSDGQEEDSKSVFYLFILTLSIGG